MAASVETGQEAQPLLVRSPKQPSLFLLFVFVMIGCTDGLLAGYMGSLLGIFTEKGVPSYIRGLLNISMTPLFLRALVSPFVDKHFSPRIGRRKSYLLPCKTFMTVYYFILSFWIDGLVQEDRVVLLTGLFLLPCILLCFENSANAGFRLEYIGEEWLGQIGAVTTLSNMLGISIGVQVFTSLHSARICSQYFGSSGRLITHGQYLVFMAIVNLLGLVSLLFMQERPAAKSQIAKELSVKRVFSALWKKRLLRDLVCVNTVFTLTYVALQILTMQYYIMQGVDRVQILFAILIVIPATLISNLLFMPFVNRGQPMKRGFQCALITVLLQSLHLPNLYYHSKTSNSSRTLLFLAIIYALDSCVPWGAFQSSALNSTASDKYSSSYLISTGSILSGSRVIVLILLNPIVDMTNVYFLLGSLLLFQTVISLLASPKTKELDNTPHEVFKQAFDHYVEGKDDRILNPFGNNQY